MNRHITLVGGNLAESESQNSLVAAQISVARGLEGGPALATHRDLDDLRKSGDFREDLYYRIACLAVRLPPLRERLDDIQLLVPELLEPVSNTMSRDFNVTADALDKLRQYDYPGNVRELRNILFIAATHSSSGEIDESTVDEVLKIQARSRSQVQPCPEPIETGSVKSDVAATPPQQDTSASMEEIEAQHITRLLEQFNNNRRQVAEAFGISERTLYRKLKRYGVIGGRPAIRKGPQGESA